MSSQDDKNEPSRFLGEGVSFKAKLIGILEVSEARGDRMCQEALADLKMAIRAAGEHKQRITINIAIDGLRLRDEKTGDSLYHHPVHKISFIAQDMSDSRAFGYIFGSPDTGHRFFGIKTDKAASQVVIAMRDLFQVVFELKKKEIELAKQHIEQKSRFGTNTSASLFADSAISNTKSYTNGDSHTTSSKLTSVSESASKAQTSSEGATARPATTSESAIADLVDLELELSSIQQGIHQMERITPSDPFGPNKDDPFASDPFGDSFTSFPQKPFLPPPPSARDRPRNTSASDTSGSLFSPKTPKTGGSVEATSAAQDLFKNSHDDQSSGWFTPTGGTDSLFEDAVKEPEAAPAKESNASILSEFDVFTELDPLGTGRKTQPTEGNLFNANFESNTHTTATTFTNNNNNALFQTDPFADGDPFDKTDPFAEDDFAKAQDPFDTDFVGDFKLFNKPSAIATSDHSEKFKFPDKLQPLFPSPLSKSPNRSSVFEKQMSLSSVSPRNTSSLSKQNTFDCDKKSFSKLSQLHENPSLDMSSESESAPEPPPRPATNITPIKPPPLPPKKQPGDIAVKPPPRPPHSEESHYDYMESYETGLNSLEGFESLEPTPPLPVPARKSRFDSDFTLAPQRPKKQFQSQSSDDDYLTPVAPPLLPPQKKNMSKDSGPILLPPPMKKDSSKRSERTNQNQVTVASYLESKPKLTSTIATDKLNLTPDTLDITLSQLTLSGLNELANKLNIPPSQLSNMTLVQLTSYLSNYVKTNNTTVSSTETSSSNDATFPTFKADFSANFNDLNSSTSKTEPYDRYAVFRELLQEELNKTTETTAQEKEETPKTEKPPEIQVTPQEEHEPELEPEEKKENIEFKPTFEESNTADRYAALREIIIEESVVSEIKENNLETMEEVNETEEEDKQNDKEKQQNDLNQESQKIKDESDINDKLNREVESNIIEYENSLDPKKDKIKSPTPTKSPTLIKSPVPIAITEIIQTSNHLTSGSVSDVVSGSSPEVDNVGSTSETVTKKNVENTTRESWAIFDTPNHRNQREANKEKQVQSEEGVSPWSSDSKEFGNGSPSDWQQRRDSGSEGDWRRRRDRDGTWWDSQGEREGHYDKPSRVTYTRDRRSTDSYDDEWYEPDRPRRRTRQQASHTWNKPGAGGSGCGAGGQSSSSRDVSPWEEEEPRGRRDREECWPPTRRSRGPSWDRERDRHRRRDDSWDEEDDYEYEDEYVSKFQWTDRHAARESDRHSGHSGPREPEHWDGGDQWTEERRHGRRRGDERWCRPDWDHDADMGERVPPTKDKVRYGRWPTQEGKWRGDRDRKRDSDRYYKRDHSQESPWEDDYSNDPDEPHSPRYLTARRNWKRPSSASEMDRKSGEIKPRQPYYMGTGGSDGERDRKYRTNRRSKSRDSQFSEMSHQRHKPDTSLTLGRYSHRNRDKMYNQKFENDFSPSESSKGKLDVKLDPSKKSATLGRKKAKELPSPKIENETLPSGKSVRKQHLMFENDFVNSETDSPVITKTKFNFENEFETSEAESPISRYSKSPRSHSESDHFPMKRNLRPAKEKETSKSPSVKQKSLFEDDFSPTDKTSQSVEDNGITVIAEETVSETRVSFTENNLDRSTPNEVRKQNKHILSKNRIANNIRGDGHIKKSESVNIFARENDPFDDDFFSGRDSVEIQKVENTKLSPSNVTEFKWTEDFDSFPEENK